MLMKQYSGRKHLAKKEFLRNGGYTDVGRRRANPPEDMPNENLQRTIDHFLDLKYITRCEANTLVCHRQQFPNRGGTSSFGSTAYKNIMLYIYVCVCI
ncbi:hypothetical protein Hanom_Chr05g00419721 [Helianthus anomalus]